MHALEPLICNLDAGKSYVCTLAAVLLGGPINVAGYKCMMGLGCNECHVNQIQANLTRRALVMVSRKRLG